MSRPPPTFGAALQRRTRVMPFEVAIWAVAIGAGVLFPRYSPLWNEIAILALFALSLDLILGYAGIVSLGHAAFFGVGAYTAGLFAKHVMGEKPGGVGAQAEERRMAERDDARIAEDQVERQREQSRNEDLAAERAERRQREIRDHRHDPERDLDRAEATGVARHHRGRPKRPLGKIASIATISA